MAIGTYAQLQTTALDWMNRAGAADDVAAAPDWVALAEARLNRELGAVETDATLTGTLNNRRIDLSALAIVQPIALFLAEGGEDEIPIPFKTDGTFAYRATSGKPNAAAFDVSTTYIDFDCPLDSAYPFRLRYRQRFALSTSATTNWLLTNHPDIYLAAVLMWGAGYNQDWPTGAMWKTLLDDSIPAVRRTIAQSRRATLSVDRALVAFGGGRSLTDWTNDA